MLADGGRHDFTQTGREPLPAREADARLSARVRRMSLLWWTAASLVLLLLNLTTEPPRAWPTDFVDFAGGSLVGFGGSLLVARRLARARRRLRREAVWEGLGLAVLGGGLCGAVAGALDLCMVNYLKLGTTAVERFAQFAAFTGVYGELCVGWCFVYLVISGSERLARIEEEVSDLRVIEYNSQSSLFRREFRSDLFLDIFSELYAKLSLRKQSESQNVVVAVAEKLRDALDRWPDVAKRASSIREGGA